MTDLPAGTLVVLAGPGVVRAGCVAGLRAFAAAGELGVANTWGAKGVFRWDSPHHLGTCGLQAYDFELLGFAGYDAIVATGIDPDESPPERFALGPVVEIAPEALASSAATLAPRSGPVPANKLYARLAAVAQPGYVDDRVPLHPARAVADIGGVLPPGGVVAADPGPAGLWVARTFPTTEPGCVIVPATRAPAAAAASAVAAAREGRAAILATAAPVDAATDATVHRAAQEGLSLVHAVWGDGNLSVAFEHAGQLSRALERSGVTRLEVPVDLALTNVLVEAAGPVVAWGGLDV